MEKFVQNCFCSIKHLLESAIYLMGALYYYLTSYCCRLSTVIGCFLFKFYLLDRARENEQEGGGTGRSSLPTEQGAQLGLNPRTWDHYLSQRQMLNKLNHPGTLDIFLTFVLFLSHLHCFKANTIFVQRFEETWRSLAHGICNTHVPCVLITDVPSCLMSVLFFMSVLKMNLRAKYIHVFTFSKANMGQVLMKYWIVFIFQQKH